MSDKLTELIESQMSVENGGTMTDAAPDTEPITDAAPTETTATDATTDTEPITDAAPAEPSTEPDSLTEEEFVELRGLLNEKYSKQAKDLNVEKPAEPEPDRAPKPEVNPFEAFKPEPLFFTGSEQEVSDKVERFDSDPAFRFQVLNEMMDKKLEQLQAHQQRVLVPQVRHISQENMNALRRIDAFHQEFPVLNDVPGALEFAIAKAQKELPTETDPLKIDNKIREILKPELKKFDRISRSVSKGSKVDLSTKRGKLNATPTGPRKGGAVDDSNDGPMDAKEFLNRTSSSKGSKLGSIFD